MSKKKLFLWTWIFIGLMGWSQIKGAPAVRDPENKGPVNFSDFFLDKTMRVDFFHSGTAAEESFAVDRVVSDGIWSGSKKLLLDSLNLGWYQLLVADSGSNLLLYSRGFSNIFNEWQSTAEAKTRRATFHESLRFPWPKKNVRVIIQKRDPQNNWISTWETLIEPGNRQVNPAVPAHEKPALTIVNNGPAAEKLDLVILGDGYTQAEMGKFRQDAQKLTDYLLSEEPYKSRKKDFNIWAVESPSQESGVTRPHAGIYKRSALSAQYSAFDSERYVLTFDNRSIRDLASAAPYDYIIIMINERTYGGGGIYNQYATVAIDNNFANYVAIHELGHSIAALADEYYTSPVAYETGPHVSVEPWETNVTALLAPGQLKWKNLVKKSTPLPTPWDKDAFDKYNKEVEQIRAQIRKQGLQEDKMEALFTEQRNREGSLFLKEKYRTEVGAFEGANYLAKGMFRPCVNCIMFTRSISFCPVCRQSLHTVFDQFTH